MTLCLDLINALIDVVDAESLTPGDCNVLLARLDALTAHEPLVGDSIDGLAAFRGSLTSQLVARYGDGQLRLVTAPLGVR